MLTDSKGFAQKKLKKLNSNKLFNKPQKQFFNTKTLTTELKRFESKIEMHELSKNQQHKQKVYYKT